MPDERVTVFVRGHVQGVGFRWWARSRALELGLVGYARNLDDGRVEIDAQGSTEALGKLIHALLEHPPRSGRPGQVTSHTIDWVEPSSRTSGFDVRF